MKEWKPYPGMQTRFLQSTAFETLAGGSRGPGKTDVGVINGIKKKYLDSPRARGLVIRKNADDLADWLDRARYYYSRYGGVITGKPGVITFPSGYRIRTGHLKDDQAYTKYQGQEYQWILIEELTQIAREIDYLKLIASCRSSIPSLDPRVYATTNPGGVGHCVREGDVLTKTGWKSIKDVQIGEEILTQDDDNNLVYIKVEQKIEEDFDGELYVSNNWSAKFECTPEHKIVRITETKNRNGRVFHPMSFVETKNLSNVTRLPKIGLWQGVQIDTFVLEDKEKRQSKLKQPFVVEGDDYCEFMGWFLSEGFTVDRDKAFGIAQMKLHNRELIRELLTRMDFDFREYGKVFMVYSSSWYEYLKQFGKCRDKFVPECIKQATKEQLRLFLDAAILGDGHMNHYYTTSRQLADDMCEIGIKIGYRIYLSSRQRPDRDGLSYDVSFKPNKVGWIEKKNLTTIPYKGKVYCVGVENHRFFLRQNGTVWLSGNSWVKNRFIDPSPPNTKFLAEDTGRTRIFLPGTVDDNPAIIDNDPDYVKMLDGLKNTDVELWKAWRLGDWDVFAGQFYREFRRDVHVIKPIMPPEKAIVVAGMDWGRTDAFAYLPSIVFTVKYTGTDKTNPSDKEERDYTFTRVITFQEAYGTDKLPREWAEAINNKWSIDKTAWVQCDNMIFNKADTDHSTSIAQQFYDFDPRFYGKLKPASKERVIGWENIHQWLSIAPDGKPYWMITENCTNLIRTLPVLVHDENNVEDVDQAGEDHAPDAARYMLKAIRFIDAKLGGVNPRAVLQSRVERIKSDKPLTIDAWLPK